MALLFSAVRVTAGDDEADSLQEEFQKNCMEWRWNNK